MPITPKNNPVSKILPGVLGPVGAGVIAYILSNLWMLFGFFGALISNFALLPFFLVGFARGLKPLLIASGIFLGLCVLTKSVSSVLFMMPFIFWIVRQGLQFRIQDGKRFYYPAGRFISFFFFCLSAVMVVVLLGALVFLQNAPGLEPENTTTDPTLHALFSSFIKQFTAMLPLEIVPAQNALNFLGRFFPGIFLGTWGIFLYIMTQFSLGLLKKLRIKSRPPFKMKEIFLHPIYLYVWGGVIMLTLMGGDIGYIAQNCLFILMIGFLFQGLGVIHAFIETKISKQTSQKENFLLFIFYSFMVLFPVFLLLIALLGVIDQVVNVRGYLKKPSSL